METFASGSTCCGFTGERVDSQRDLGVENPWLGNQNRYVIGNSVPPMALLGIVFLALLLLGFSTCIVGVAIWLIAFWLPPTVMISLLATTNDTMYGEDLAQQRCLRFLSRRHQLS
jgi:hypothetical protein